MHISPRLCFCHLIVVPPSPRHLTVHSHVCLLRPAPFLLSQILREMVFPPLPEAEWRRPQQQQQQQQQRRASSIRSGGSSPPSSPLSGRRLSVSPRPLSSSGGGGSLSPNSRRRLSIAASSLSGLLSPRYTTDSSPSSPSKSQRVTSRSLSPPAFRESGREQRSEAREQRRQQRELAAANNNRSREASPDRNAGGTPAAVPSRRRRSMSMPWSAASLSSMLPSSSPSSSLASSARAAAIAPPKTAGTHGSEPLSPRLAVTVMPAATSAMLGGSFPSSDSAGGAALSACHTTGNGGAWVTAAPAGEGCAAAADGSCHKLPALGGVDAFEQKNGLGKWREEETVVEAAARFSGGVPSCSLEPSAAARPSRSRGGGNDDAAGAETGTLSSAFDEAEGQEEASEIGAVGGKEVSPNGDQGQGEQGQDRGEGGPTQVLCVPEIATRDTEEFLGIQVRISRPSHDRPCLRVHRGYMSGE